MRCSTPPAEAREARRAGRASERRADAGRRTAAPSRPRRPRSAPSGSRPPGARSSAGEPSCRPRPPRGRRAPRSGHRARSPTAGRAPGARRLGPATPAGGERPWPGNPIRTREGAREHPGAMPGDRGQASGVSSPGSVAIVTGGSCSRGRVIARALASRGYAVVLVYLRAQADAESAVEEIVGANGTALAVRADLTDVLDVERLFGETEAALGEIDVVVHAARCDGSVLDQQAACRLRHGGAVIDASGSAAGRDAEDLLRRLSRR